MEKKSNIIFKILKVFSIICFFPFVLIYWCFKSNGKNDGLTMEEITDHEELMEE